MSLQLDRLRAVHFRNHREVDLDLGPEVNCFVGNNGTGKTNLLDAVHYLSLCKSYFEAVDQHNILHGEDFFLVQGTMRHRGRGGPRALLGSKGATEGGESESQGV
jgi:DNA replication and repair protein RecF